MVLLRKVLTLIIALCSVFVLRAEAKVSLTVEAPMTVVVGEPFRIAFNVNAEPDKGTLEVPDFDNFDLIAGPSTSSSSSVQIINGKTTRQVSYGYTYVLVPQKAGTFTLRSATISVGGKRYSSKPIAVEVRASQSSEQGGATIGKEDLKLRLELSKKSVYKGEPIRATLKLYSCVDLAGIDGAKMPTFNGFWSQPVEVDESRNPSRETINNKVYEVYNLAEYILYPQQENSLTIEPAELTVVALVRIKSNQVYDPFFGGGYETLQIRRELKTPEVKVKIKPFPAGAPASFAGAVGSYTMTHEISTSEVAANSSVTLQLTIAGAGNLNFVSAPKLSLPPSFELYDVTTEEKLETSASGSKGYRRFDYPFIARAKGEYEIAPVEFTYFDLATQKYKTLATPPLKMVVTADKGASTATPSQQSGKTPAPVRKVEKEQKEEDIRYIKRNTKLRSVETPLVLSPTYWWIVVAMLVAAVLSYLIVSKRMRDNSDEVLVKGRRANRVAVRRFRVAAKYMQEQNSSAFYKEMLNGLWGYMSDRFNIPVAELKREVVREELQRRGASAEAEMFIAVIERCEEAQYSPIASAEMKSIYDEGVEAVSKIEKIAK